LPKSDFGAKKGVGKCLSSAGLKPDDSDFGSFLMIFFVIFLTILVMKIRIFFMEILDFGYETS